MNEWRESERGDVLRNLQNISDACYSQNRELESIVEALRYIGHVEFEALCLRYADAVVAADKSEKKPRKAGGLTAKEKTQRLQAAALGRLKAPPWESPERKEARDGQKD